MTRGNDFASRHVRNLAWRTDALGIQGYHKDKSPGGQCQPDLQGPVNLTSLGYKGRFFRPLAKVKSGLLFQDRGDLRLETTTGPLSRAGRKLPENNPFRRAGPEQLPAHVDHWTRDP